MSMKVTKAGSSTTAAASHPYDNNAPAPMREGGPHVCTAGTCADAPFTTKDWKEWLTHLKTHDDSFEQGHMPCAECGNDVDMSVVPTRAGHRAICKTCRENRVDEF